MDNILESHIELISLNSEKENSYLNLNSEYLIRDVLLYMVNSVYIYSIQFQI